MVNSNRIEKHKIYNINLINPDNFRSIFLSFIFLSLFSLKIILKLYIEVPCRPRWSRGNVLASRSKVRRFKTS